jgi:hypothetical protein
MNKLTEATCPYCGEAKPAGDFTQEHVLPRALGGNLQPQNPFAISVCRRCNSSCGRWVDGPFVRSWHIYNWRAESQRRSYDAKGILPLTWMGRLGEWPGGDGTVADFWLGPARDSIYHFHLPYEDDDANVFAGVPPYVNPDTVDPGSVYIDLVGGSQEWFEIVERSAVSKFGKGASRHYLNGAPPGVEPPFPPVPLARQAHIDWIGRRKPDEQIRARIGFEIDFGQRFLAKWALGTAVAVIGEQYAATEYGRLLRHALWARKPVERAQLKLRGRSFLRADPIMTSVFGWNDCHTASLIPSGGELVAILTLYGKHQASIVLSDEPALWDTKVAEQGAVWVIAPGFGRFAGPMALPDYLHAAFVDAGPLLGQLRDVLVAGAPLPPFQPLAPVVRRNRG